MLLNDCRQKYKNNRHYHQNLAGFILSSGVKMSFCQINVFRVRSFGSMAACCEKNAAIGGLAFAECKKFEVLLSFMSSLSAVLEQEVLFCRRWFPFYYYCEICYCLSVSSHFA